MRTAGLAAYARPHGDRRRPRRDPGPRGGRARTRVAPRPERRCGRPSSGMGNREPDRPPRERLPRARRGRGSRRGAGECLRALGRGQRDRPRGAFRLGRPRRRPGRGGAAAWPRDRRGLARHAVRGHAPLAGPAGLERAIAEPSLPFFIQWAPESSFPGASRRDEPDADGIARLVLSGAPEALAAWLGDHALPMDVRLGPPAGVSLVLERPAGETVVEAGR